MTDQKPVVCRYCGSEMCEASDGDSEVQGTAYFYHCSGCYALSPSAHSPEAAYTAATRTPENKPLTRDQVMELEDMDAVWLVYSMDSERDKVLSVRDYIHARVFPPRDTLVFAAKPTPEDIRKAREANGTEQVSRRLLLLWQSCTARLWTFRTA